MKNPHRMSLLERPADAVGDMDGPVLGEAPGSPDDDTQFLSLDVLHDDVVDFVIGTTVVDDLDGITGAKGHERLLLPIEPRDKLLVIGEFGPCHLDDAGSIVKLGLSRHVDHAEAAPP